MPINAYGASKRAVEEILRDFGVSHGLEAVVFCISTLRAPMLKPKSVNGTNRKLI
jgi:nucleoside-diphosphate-sugar epimerase